MQRLSWCSLQESLDGVRLGGGDCGGTDQGGVGAVWWNFLAILTLATCPVVTFRAITSSAPLVPAVAELGAIVELPLHIPERTNIKVICRVRRVGVFDFGTGRVGYLQKRSGTGTGRDG